MPSRSLSIDTNVRCQAAVVGHDDLDVRVCPHQTDECRCPRIGVCVRRRIDFLIDYVQPGFSKGVDNPHRPLAAIAARFGIGIDNATVQDPAHRFKDVSTWVLVDPAPPPAGDGGLAADVFARVAAACFYRAGVLTVADAAAATVFARTHASATPPRAPLLVGARAGAGRVVIAADSDFVGDDSIVDLDNRSLWLNIVTWAAVRDRQPGGAT
jgi:hypothetical protein